MANLLTSLWRRSEEISRYSLTDYIRQITAGYGLTQQAVSYTAGGKPAERIPNSYVGYAEQAYGSSSVVGACMRVRRDLFSQARFTWRELTDDGTGQLSHDEGLSLLDQPWPNGTTGELLVKMITDVDLCGNSFVVNEGDRLRWRRPDWMYVVLSGDPLIDYDVDILGYIYCPGGTAIGDGKPYLLDEVCHWSPIPHPTAAYIGMSWMTSALKDIQGDIAATEHKNSFFRNGAVLGPIFRLPATMTPEQFKKFKQITEETHTGEHNAYRTLYVGGGAEVTLAASTFQQLELKATQGANETRVAALAGVHPTIVGLSEGLAGSSLNAGNFTAARRLVADITLHKLWQDACAALSTFVDVPEGKELWIRESEIPFLREDAKDAAEIFNIQMQSANNGVREGWEPETSKIATAQRNIMLLKHTGNVSVQLQPPGAEGTTAAPTGLPVEEEYEPIDFGALRSDIYRRFDPAQPRDGHGRWALVGFVSHLLGSAGEVRVWHDPEDSDGPRIELAVGSADHLRDWDQHITTPWQDRQRDDESRQVDFMGEELVEVRESLAKAAAAASAGRKYHEEHFGSDHGQLFVDSDGANVVLSNRHHDDPDYFWDDAAEQLEEEAWEAHWAANPPGDADEDEWSPTIADAQIKARAKQLLSEFQHPEAVLAPQQAQRLVETLTTTTPEANRSRYGEGPGERIAPGHKGGGRFRKLTDRLTDLLEDWVKGDGPDDPLDEFSREQLRTTAKKLADKARADGDNDRAARLTPRRMRPGEDPERLRDEIKLALYKDIRATRRGEREPRTAPSKEQQVADRLGALSAPAREDAFTRKGEVDEVAERLERLKSADDIRDALADVKDARTLRGVARRWNVEVPPGMNKPDDIRGHIAEKVAGDKASHRGETVEGIQPAKKAAPKLSDDPDVRAVQVENRIREAYRKAFAAANAAGNRRSGLIPLADIRDHLSDLDRAEVDAVLTRMARTGGARLTPNEDRKRRTARDRDAALRIPGYGSEDANDWLTIDDPSPRPLPEPKKVTPAKKAAPKAASAKADLTGANGLSSDPDVREVQIENRIRAAWNNRPEGTRFVGLADLRESIGADVPRAEVDAALTRLSREPGAGVRPADMGSTFPWTAHSGKWGPLRQQDHDAALVLGGTPRHMIDFADPAGGGTVADADVYKTPLRPLPKGVSPAKKAAPRAPDMDLPTVDPEALRDALDLKKVPELKDMLREAGLPVSGRKRELVDRLVEHRTGGGTKEAPATKAPKVDGPEIEVVKSSKDLTITESVRGEHLTPAGRRALDALGPTGHPRIAAISGTEEKVREAHLMLAIPGAGYDSHVALTDLRKLIGDQVTREELDATLKRMSMMPDVRLNPQSYERDNAKTRIPAAVMIGGQENNLLVIDDPRLARPGQFAALDLADELDTRREGKSGDPMMALLSDAELSAEIDRRAAKDPLVARDLKMRQRDIDAPAAEAKGRARQAQIDDKRTVADGVGEVLELLDNGVSPEGLRKRISASGLDDASKAKLLAGADTDVDNRVRAAFQAVAARSFTPDSNVDLRQSGWVRLADLRDELGEGMSRQEVDASLKRLAQSHAASIIPESAQFLLRPEDRDAELIMGGQRKHWVKVDDPSPKPGSDAAARDLASSAGLTQVGEHGAPLSFDSTQHTTVGGEAIRPGQKVAVIRPGYVATVDGEPVVVSKAKVETWDDSLHGPLARAEDLSDDDLAIIRAAGHDTTLGNDELHHWWVYGEGRSRWNTWTELVAALVEAVEGKPLETLKKWAASWFHERYGFWPGDDRNRVRQGKPPRGERIGPG